MLQLSQSDKVTQKMDVLMDKLNHPFMNNLTSKLVGGTDAVAYLPMTSDFSHLCTRHTCSDPVLTLAVLDACPKFTNAMLDAIDAFNLTSSTAATK
jgi:hypothetical protein